MTQKQRETESIKPGALSDVRVLDLANPMGIYCTKLFADLGADVIRVEPSGGDPVRNLGPFFKDDVHPEKSLYWFHMNTSKRSITLNLETSDGVSIFKRLAARSDMIVETFKPGYLDSIGLGYAVLSTLNPGLILVSITGFGQTGPWKDYKAPDIVGLAVGGVLHISGWPDLPPTTLGGSQAYHQTSAQAAAGALVALWHSTMTGEGQHVDVSMQQIVPLSHQTNTLSYEKVGRMSQRGGYQHKMSPGIGYGVMACSDGYVDIRIQRPRWDDLVKWLDSEGMAGDLKEEKWQDPSYRVKPEAIEHAMEIVGAFLKKRTKREASEEGQRRRLIIMPVNTAKEVAADPQLNARNFFVDVEHPELGTSLKYLGVPYQLSETPARISRRAPLIGEHNWEIYGQELGYSKDELVQLKQMGII
ncbi:CaiB/BaiF CoA transferase family protein [Thermodesulfobacteriota bacterium]